MSGGRQATPEEQAAIDAIHRRLDELSAALAEDSRRWWERFERDREQWRQETEAAFAPARAQLDALQAEVRALADEVEPQPRRWRWWR